MPDKKPLFQKINLTYLTSVISLTLLLFILGLQIFLWLAAKKISNNISDDIAIELVLKGDATDNEIAKLKSSIESSQMILNTNYISKEEAAKKFEKEIGENFLELTGYNPLFSSLEVHLKPEFNTKKNIDSWIESNRKFPIVDDVIYKEDVAQSITQTITKINYVFSGFTLLLLITAILMIYNNNRISIFTQRFSIKTMYLVGASQYYIIKPFLFRAIRHSVYAIVLSSVFILLLFKYIGNVIPEISQIADALFYTKLFSALAISGILFTMLSTAFAIKAVLSTNPDKIY